MTDAAAFDHQHENWDRLLEAHVVWSDDGHASRVGYAGFQGDRTAFKSYLDALSGVDQELFDTWTKAQQLAFLINAYNAFTIELVLSEYPDLRSIKELGSLFSSPWRKRFFVLLGKKRHLDELEHGLIRQPGIYREPRIHFALVCASIGCPALRDEAYTADRLEKQLEDSLVRFLSDKSRNRYNGSQDRLEVSRIFDWYEADFSVGANGHGSLADFFAGYARFLAETPEQQRRIRARKVDITYLEYDWGLNDLRR